MAIRLALTLGLHTSTHRYVEEGKMTAAEANARNVTMWGSFLNDWCVQCRLSGKAKADSSNSGCGLYLGRPSYTNVKDIASDKPYLDNHSLSWIEYISSDEQASGLTSFRDPQASLMDRWAKLYEIMSKLGYSMYVTTAQIIVLDCWLTCVGTSRQMHPRSSSRLWVSKRSIDCLSGIVLCPMSS